MVFNVIFCLFFSRCIHGLGAVVTISANKWVIIVQYSAVQSKSKYSKDSINGTPLVQSLVSHLHKNPTYKLQLVWYCGFRFFHNCPIYIRIPIIYCPTHQVVTVCVNLHKNPSYIQSHLSGPHCMCEYELTAWKEMCCRVQSKVSCLHSIF